LVGEQLHKELCALELFAGRKVFSLTDQYQAAQFVCAGSDRNNRIGQKVHFKYDWNRRVFRTMNIFNGFIHMKLQTVGNSGLWWDRDPLCGDNLIPVA
jgi:hypothetical protein